MSEKKCRKLGWATAHFQFELGHDTTNYIMTQDSWAQPGVPRYSRAGAGARSRKLRDGPAIRPRGATTLSARAQGHAVARARTWPSRGMSRYNQLYCERRAVWPARCVTIQTIVS